jgi:hypothetical protein
MSRWYLDDLNGTAGVVGGQELGVLEAEAIHVDNDCEACNLRLRFLDDVLQSQHIRAEYILDAHIRCITFLCNNTVTLLPQSPCFWFPTA